MHQWEKPHPKPVKKIELSEKHFSRRLFLAILLFVVGCAAMIWGISGFFSGQNGWTEIAVRSDAEINCGEDFTFLYELGAGEESATVEQKKVSKIYSDAAVEAYEAFNADESFEGVGNVYTLNHSPNEAVEISPALYQALEIIVDSGDRKLYLGPVYEMYDDLFFCTDDAQTADFDPYQNSEIAAYYQEIADFARDENAVQIQLLGDNQAKLYVSDEYLAYAKENEIETYLDFFWMKNAFIADYLADTLTQAGCTHGAISSYDGYTRCLDSREDVNYTLPTYTYTDDGVTQGDDFTYTGPMSIVTLRDYPLTEKDSLHYYQFVSGEIRTCYLDPADGKCKSTVHELTETSADKSCGELLLKISGKFISGEQW